MKIICTKSNLAKGVSIVSKAVPSKTTMPILECILIDASTDVIKLTANDMELGIETSIEGEIIDRGIIAINARIFSEIVRKLPDSDVVIETDSDSQAMITCEKAKFNIASRLIEGEYFRIDQMLSSEYETKVRINKRELLDCIDRATLLIKEGDKKPIIIDIRDDSMELKIKSQFGSMDEVILCTKEGKDLLIGFNPKFLIDALRVIDDEEVDLYFMNAKAPCFIKDETQSYIYLILPVNFNAAV